jgi:hypothetical protein
MSDLKALLHINENFFADKNGVKNRRNESLLPLITPRDSWIPAR